MRASTLATVDDLGERGEVVEVPEDGLRAGVAVPSYLLVDINVVHSGEGVCIQEAGPCERTEESEEWPDLNRASRTSDVYNGTAVGAAVPISGPELTADPYDGLWLAPTEEGNPDFKETVKVGDHLHRNQLDDSHNQP